MPLIKLKLNNRTYNINTELYPLDYGYKLAEQAIQFGYMCYNLYEPITDNISQILAFSKAYGIIKSTIDTEDIPKLSKHTWRPNYSKRMNKFYMENTNCGKIHRFILNLPRNENKDLKIDHIDRNPLNNCKINLRKVSQAENCRNSSIRSDNTSGIKGIRFESKRNRWASEIYVDNIKYNKTFAVSKYGYETAKEMAIEYRRKIAMANGYINPFN